MLKSAFQKLDLDGNGKLDQREIAAILENSNIGDSMDEDEFEQSLCSYAIIYSV